MGVPIIAYLGVLKHAGTLVKEHAEIPVTLLVQVAVVLAVV